MLTVPAQLAFWAEGGKHGGAGAVTASTQSRVEGRGGATHLLQSLCRHNDGPSLRRAHCSDGKTEVPAGELTRPSHTARNTGQALSQAPLPPSKGVAQSSSRLGSRRQ